MPVRATPDDIQQGRARLDELATAAGRDPKALDVTVFGENSDRDAIKRFEDAGADRVIVRLASTADDSALDELERMARCGAGVGYGWPPRCVYMPSMLRGKNCLYMNKFW